MFSKLLHPHHFKLQTCNLAAADGLAAGYRLDYQIYPNTRTPKIAFGKQRRRGGDGDAAAPARREEALPSPARAPMPRRAAPRRAAPAVRLGVVLVAGRGRWQQEAAVGGV